MFPDAVATLVLDGSVDPSLSIPQFTSSTLFALNDIMAQLLSSCFEDYNCNSDLCGMQPEDECRKLYPELDLNLRKHHQSVRFVVPTGKIKQRELGDSDLDALVVSMLYDPFDRSELLRALAAAVKYDDWAQLLRWFYVVVGIDEDSLLPNTVQENEVFSDASYYAITSSDYSAYIFQLSDQKTWASEYVSQGSGLLALPFGALWFSDLPDAFFAVEAQHPLPPRLSTTNFSVMIIASDVDPATPFSQSLNVREL